MATAAVRVISNIGITIASVARSAMADRCDSVSPTWTRAVPRALVPLSESANVATRTFSPSLTPS